MKWQLIAIAACVMGLCIVCMVLLAIKGLIPAAAATGIIGAAFGAFNGWLIPNPAHPKEDE